MGTYILKKIKIKTDQDIERKKANNNRHSQTREGRHWNWL